MELENLKSIWNELETQPTPEKDGELILALLQKRSRGPVARMRHNLIRELLLISVTYIPVIIFYLVEFEGRLSAISGLLFLLGLFFCGYYYRKMKLLKEMQCVTCMVRPNLARQVETLKKYTRFYLLAGTLIIPFTAIYVYAILRWKLPHASGLRLYHQLSPAPWWTNSIYWLLLLAPLTIVIYYLNAWYINRLYGRHIKKLQELLREMDEE
jgi:ABC-type Fe3+ transport system permease subunit